METHGSLGIVTELNVDVTMRDGIRLRANVWRPDAGGPFPGLLVRTPYGKPGAGYARYVRAGYAVVAMDTRGRYASEGEYVPFSDPAHFEAEDGYDSVEWLADQPWCNGRVGTMGTSYPAWMQWTMAKLRPPHLQAMCACSIPVELTGVDWPGIFKPGRRICWWLTTMAPDLRERAGMPPPHTPAEAREIWHELEHARWLGLLPWIKVADYLPPPLDRYVHEWLRDPGRKVWNFLGNHCEIDVPNLDVTGWYDHCWSLDHLPSMQQNARTAVAREQSKTIVGPYAHNTLGKRLCNTVDFGANADLDLDGLKIRWFDYWLKDLANGIDHEPPVRYFVMGSSEWRHAPTWPPEANGQKVLYLASNGEANRPDGGGTLEDETPSTGGDADLYTYDPHNPVPTLWTRNLFSGASDRSALAHRRDILIYRGEALQEEITIAGDGAAVLYIKSSAVDTDFFVRLVDEHPDGKAIEVAAGALRTRYRDGMDREELLHPGKVTELTIPLAPTAICFQKGHRIRIDITSSDFPSFDRNHNTGENDLETTEMVVAEQTVLHSPDFPSRIEMPVIGER